VLVVDAVTVTDVVDVAVDVVVGPKDVVAVVVVVVVIVVDDVVVAVVAVVDELQDAKIMEATMRRVINPQRVPFFACSSFFIVPYLIPRP